MKLKCIEIKVDVHLCVRVSYHFLLLIGNGGYSIRITFRSFSRRLHPDSQFSHQLHQPRMFFISRDCSWLIRWSTIRLMGIWHQGRGDVINHQPINGSPPTKHLHQPIKQLMYPMAGETWEADAYCSLFVCIFVLMATASSQPQADLVDLGGRTVGISKNQASMAWNPQGFGSYCGHIGDSKQAQE